LGRQRSLKARVQVFQGLLVQPQPESLETAKNIVKRADRAAGFSSNSPRLYCRLSLLQQEFVSDPDCIVANGRVSGFSICHQSIRRLRIKLPYGF
jgi:hypothetical protein